jgi:hypothetical protein
MAVTDKLGGFLSNANCRMPNRSCPPAVSRRRGPLRNSPPVMYWARKAARDELRRKGFKVSDYTAAEITTLARTYLDAHRAELIAQAKEVIRTSPLFAQWS